MTTTQTLSKTTYHYSRRGFIGAAASSAFAFSFLPSRVFGANERLQVAGIGVGGKGKGDFDGLAMHGDVIAACDVDSRRLDVAVRKHPDAATTPALFLAADGFTASAAATPALV